MPRILRRLGYVKLEDYGLEVSPDGVLVALPPEQAADETDETEVEEVEELEELEELDEFDVRAAGTGSEHRPLFIDADTIPTGCPEAVVRNEKVIVDEDS